MVTRQSPVQSLRKTRAHYGKTLRKQAPRSAYAKWKAQTKGRDVLAMLAQSNVGRVKNLVPLRYARMIQSPFAFLRGSAGIMAFDLGHCPNTGLRVQACGDCHLMNFGAFATPERQVIFDINDFDETLPAPWEWDIKRLAASIMVAGRYRGFTDSQSANAVLIAVRAYREALAEYATWPTLRVWYARIDAAQVIGIASDVGPARLEGAQAGSKAASMAARLLPKLIEGFDGKLRIKDEPPLIFHPLREKAFFGLFRDAILRYRKSLPAERRILFNHYEVVDVAMKVVGVGSVGTVCAVALMQADMDDHFFLQIKQARPSVLEPYAGRSEYRDQGERVVVGQRMMQSASDMFLGWSKVGKPPLEFYFRQLRDMKISVSLDAMEADEFTDYVHYCGWAVARAHARTGDASAISGYLGGSDVFDQALMHFARRYADQTERDHAVLVKAVKSGRVHANAMDTA